ncbi:hypothetical protein CK203_038433 [Vitis vinifera]|uniref:Uncharacterized protein n=1 Tax=Vitis vinifera TaxID=29760 RepID=A0A438IS35_VITVI|nr:hypothetical protein CK203_038433 [Vitis vinifera]
MASSSSATLNHSIDLTTVVPSLSNLPFTISVKLNSSNYPIWKVQALPYFRGQAVFGYLDGTIPTPPQEIDAPHPSIGLGQEYDSLASTITSRSDPITLEEFYSLLLI